MFIINNHHLKHIEYIQKACTQGIIAVTLPDRKPLLDYLTDKVSSFDLVQLNDVVNLNPQKFPDLPLNSSIIAFEPFPLRVRLDTAYFFWNWKYCSEINFKCVNSAVGPIFNEKIAEKCNLWDSWTVHRCTIHNWPVNSCGLNNNNKKKEEKNAKHNAKRKHHISPIQTNTKRKQKRD